MDGGVLRVVCLLAVALMALGASGPTAAQALVADRVAAQAPGPAPTATLVGTTIDSSAGVLPGVTVTVAAADGRTLATTVTDASGAFRFDSLPPGRLVLLFHLAGFGESREAVTLQPRPPHGADQMRIEHRMELGAVSESLTVRGDLPAAPAPPPRPRLEPVADHDQLSVCGPALADGDVPAFGTVRSRRDDESKVLFATGDELLIDGGVATGLGIGQNFVVRRRYPTALRYGRKRSMVVMGEHSSGLLQVVDVEDHFATAIVVYACDEMMRGDYLVPFDPKPVRAPDPTGKPMFDRAAKILFADAGQPLGVTGRMMVIDQGADDDLRAGQRVTLFRRSRFGDGWPLVVGEAFVVSLRARSATIHVEHATDAIFFGDRGDWAAPHAPPSRAGN